MQQEGEEGDDNELQYTPQWTGRAVVLKVPWPNDTCKNSIYYCIQRVYMLQKALLSYILPVGVSVEREFTAACFELLADLIDCLGPVCDFALEIQAANCPTIHTILLAMLC